MTAEWRSAAARLAGVFLLLVPFVPVARVFGSDPTGGRLVPPGEWLLGLAIVAAVAWVLSLLPGPRSALSLPGRPAAQWWTAAGLPILAALLLAAGWFVFRHRPLLVDGVAQLFQARVFAGGSASAPPPPDEAFFVVQHLVVDGGGWYSQYPPGHAALLAPGAALGFPWLVPVALCLGTALLLHGFAREVYDRETAGLTLLLLVLCPFFWFMGASFMNHVSALFFVALLLRLLAGWERRGTAVWLMASGLALGALGITRPLTALAVGAALAPFVLVRAVRRRRWGALAGAGTAALAMASLYLAFNALTTGDPLLTGYVRLWGEGHGLGFHATPWGGEHTALAGLRNELTDLGLLGLYLFEWPVPAVLPLGAFFALGLDDQRWDRRLLAGFLAIPAAYFFYWHRDAYLGPRFLYEGIAFLLPLTARAIRVGLQRLPDRTGARRSRLVPESPVGLAQLALLLCFGYAVLYGIPQRFRVYATGLASMKVDLADRAREAGVEGAVVFVAVSWGNRLLAELRGLGLPASVAERAYRTLDHCDLEGLKRRAREEAWDSRRLTIAVERRLADPPPRLVKPRLNGDLTLRLRPDRPLTRACRDEVAYDAAGYTVYTPHLLANTPELDGPLLVARDLRERNGELRARHPDRPAYLWRGAGFEALP